jgi:hypothetical protein
MYALLALILLLQTSTVAPSHPKEPIDKNISTDLPKGAPKHKAQNKSSPVVTGNTPNNKENSAAQTANDEQQPYGVTYRIETVPQATEGRWFKGYVIATVFIALLNIGTLVVIWLQFRHMRLEQRAWVSIERPRIVGTKSNQLKIGVRLRNTGRTPAKGVVRFMDITLEKPGKRPNFVFTEPVGANTIIFPNGEIAAYKTLDCDNETVRQINSRDLSIWAHGKVVYRDIFEREHWVTFCIVKETIGESFKAHTEYNEIDNT